MRRTRAIDFCELCEDHGTRLIAITTPGHRAEEWRRNAFWAAMKHEESTRIPATASAADGYNFEHDGGCLNPPSGGSSSAGCKSDGGIDVGPGGAKAPPRRLVGNWKSSRTQHHRHRALGPQSPGGAGLT